MRRPARLVDAGQWLSVHEGPDVMGDYQRWYGVDRLCAVIELRMLGVPISEEEEVQVRKSIEQCTKLRLTKRAAKKRANKQRSEEKRAAKQRAAAERAAKRAEKRDAKKHGRPADLYGYADLAEFEWRWNESDPDAFSASDEASLDAEWNEASLDAGWDEASFDAGSHAVSEVTPESFGGYGARPIEYHLLEDIHALDLRVIEKVKTKIERCDEAIMHVRITLEDDPEVLARCAWGLIFAIGTFSFDDARVDADYDVDIELEKIDEWTAGDMLRCLSFDGGRLYFHADHVRGRCMHTTVEIDREGKITLETVNRGGAAMRWIAKLQGKKAMAVAEEGQNGASLDSLPF